MTGVPNPAYIYHITALTNLPKIWASKALYCKRRLDAAKAGYQSIAYENLQQRRATRVVRPGATLHDFVPFTFAPRSPMLRPIESGLVAGYGGGQLGVAHIVSAAEDVAKAKLDWLFSDYHAVMAYAQFYGDLTDLDKINWSLFFEPPLLGGYCKYWNNRPETEKYVKRSETRQAELLVHDTFPVQLIRGIGVANDKIASELIASFASVGWNVPIKAKPEWYY